MKEKMYHFPETRMRKIARARAVGDTLPVMKEMKEKNPSSEAPRPEALSLPPPPPPPPRGRGGGGELFCILSTF